MDKKNEIQLSDYQKSIHKVGPIWFVAVYLFIMAFPVVVSIYFDAWPKFSEFLAAAIGVVPLYWTVGIVEAFTYMPMLGAGGSYLAFITGNLSNLKIPVAINSMESLGIQQGTEEGDVISTISIAASSIVTTLIIILFVILMVPLTPIFSNPALQPAFDNIIPALFGGLMVVLIAKDIKVGLPIILLGAALFIAFPALASIYPVVLPILAVLAIILARILYKKGKI